MTSVGENEQWFEAIKLELCAGAKKFLAAQASEAPGEHVYGFMFMLSPGGDYVLAIAGTEDLLARTAQEYCGNGYQAKSGDTATLLRQGLKWLSLEDFWYGQSGDSCDEAAQLLEDALEKELIKPGDGQAEHVCIKALLALDAEGVFGHGADREKIVLSLSHGMMSAEDILRWAGECNPPEVTARLKAEIEAGAAANENLESPWKDQ